MSQLSDFAGKRILITGGLGFIGSNLARRLVSLGARPTLLDSMIPLYGGNLYNVRDLGGDVAVNIADVRDSSSIGYLIQGVDYLFNLAAQTSHVDSMADPGTDLAINAAAQLSILEACRRNNRDLKIIFASTRQLYGKPQYLPVDELHPINPIDVNGINKLAGEWYHLLYYRVYGIRSCVLRLTNTYGPRMRVKDARQTFVGIWIRHVIEGKPLQIFGDGQQRRDLNFVDDVVDALLLAASEPYTDGEVFNLGSNEVVSLEQLAQMMGALYPSVRYELVPFPSERQPIDIGDYYGDFRKFQKVTGWNPKVSLEQGLAETLDYFQQHHEHYWDAT